MVDMDLELTEQSISYFSRKKLNSIRKEKLRREIESARKLLTKEIEPLRVADEFIHDIIRLMEDGIYRENPKLTQDEVIQKIREKFAIIEKIKKLRKRGRHLWQS